jgi:hypothetical protein
MIAESLVQKTFIRHEAGCEASEQSAGPAAQRREFSLQEWKAANFDNPPCGQPARSDPWTKYAVLVALSAQYMRRR